MSKKIEFSLLGLMVIVLVAKLLFTVVSRYIIHDVFVHLDIASRLLEGKKPYIDYIETNFPTIHYLHIPPVWLSTVTAYDVITTFHIYMFFLTLLSAGLIIYLISQQSNKWKNQRLVLNSALPILTLCSGFLFWGSFGQREHIFMLMFIPLIILSWSRWESSSKINPVLAIFIGFWAGIALTIKPYFFIIMAVILLFDLVMRKQWRLWIYPEYQGLVLAGILYVGFALLNWESTYVFLSDQMVQTINNYVSYGSGANIFHLLADSYPLETLVLIGLLFGWSIFRHSKTDFSVLSLYIACLMIASLIIVILQDKGWSYHFVPYKILGHFGFAVLILYGISLKNIKYLEWIRLFFLAGMIFIILKNIQLNRLVDNSLWIAEKYSQEDDPILGVFTHTWFSTYSILADRKNVTTYLTAHPIPFELAKFSDVSDIYAGNNPYISEEIQKYLNILQQDIETHHPILIFIEGDCFVCPDGFYTSNYLNDIGFIDEVMGEDYQLIIDDPRYVIYQRIK